MPTVVPTDSRALSCPPIGALPRNRLASSATGGASPISPPAGTQPPLGKGAEGTGERIATGALRPRNDGEFYMGAGNVRRADRGVCPYGRARGPYGRAVGDAGPYGSVSWDA